MSELNPGREKKEYAANEVFILYVATEFGEPLKKKLQTLGYRARIYPSSLLITIKYIPEKEAPPDQQHLSPSELEKKIKEALTEAELSQIKNFGSSHVIYTAEQVNIELQTP